MDEKKSQISSLHVPLSLALSATLLWSGFVHLSGPYFFLESVLAYEILPYDYAWIFAPFLIHLSLVLGLSTGGRMFRPGSYFLCSSLFFVFVTVQLYAYFSDKAITCGCFGPSDARISWESISIPLLFMFLSIYLYFVDRPENTIERSISTGASQ